MQLFDVHHSIRSWRLVIALAIAIPLFPEKIFSQSSHQIFEHLTTEHGLSSDKVSGVIQDSEGFYWIATQNGLNRFDGTSFRIYRHDPGDSSSLTSNSCTSMVEDLNGDIWIATYTGISKFVKSTGKFERIYLHHPDQDFEITNRVYSLALDGDGNIWIAGFGVWKYDVLKNQLTRFKNESDNPVSFSGPGLITEIIFDHVNNGLWFSTNEDVNFYSIERQQFYHASNNPEGWKIFDVAYPGDMALDNKNRLWFRELNSIELLAFDIDKNEIIRTGKSLEYGVHKICSDDLNRVWLLYWLANSEIYDPVTGKTITDFFLIHH